MTRARRTLRILLCVVAATALLLAPPAAAQSGVILGTGEELLHILDNNGSIAIDFDVDDVNFFLGEEILIGRADLAGTDEADIDIEMVDNDSTLAVNDVSIHLNSSGADIILGSGSSTEPGDAGTLFLEDGLGTTRLSLEGSDFDINQGVDNSEVGGFDGNGAVKAWAIIESDGTVQRCWNCNTSTSQTQMLATGRFEVDFTLGDIDNRPVLATVACTEPIISLSALTFQCAFLNDVINISPRQNDASSFYVTISDDDVDVNADFTIVVF